MPPIWKRQNRYLLDWWSFDRSIRQLKQHLETHQLTALVAIARGGLVPAVVLAHHLKIYNFSVIAMTRNQSNEMYSDRQPPLITAELQIVLEGQDVLIVDDIVGEGETMLMAKNQIMQYNPRSIQTLALAVNQGSTFKPDFFIFEVDDWVIFPWEANVDGNSDDVLIRL